MDNKLIGFFVMFLMIIRYFPQNLAIAENKSVIGISGWMYFCHLIGYVFMICNSIVLYNEADGEKLNGLYLPILQTITLLFTYFCYLRTKENEPVEQSEQPINNEYDGYGTAYQLRQSGAYQVTRFNIIASSSENRSDSQFVKFMNIMKNIRSLHFLVFVSLFLLTYTCLSVYMLGCDLNDETFCYQWSKMAGFLACMFMIIGYFFQYKLLFDERIIGQISIFSLFLEQISYCLWLLYLYNDKFAELSTYAPIAISIIVGIPLMLFYIGMYIKIKRADNQPQQTYQHCDI